MNSIAALGILIAGGVAVLWAVQSLVLFASGEKLALPLRYRTEKPLVVYPMKVMVQLGWLLIILGYPLLIGTDPMVFYGNAFRPPAPVGAMIIMAVACIAGFALIYLIYLSVGAIELAFIFSRRKTNRRLVACLLTPVPLAIMEEAVFRAVLLHALLGLSSGRWGIIAAIVISSAIFSLVHFIRRRDSKRKPMLQPAIGLFFVGVVLGTAYVAGGQTLWLPVTAHAAGILAVELPRSFVIYKADPKWIGFRSFPHSGPLGVIHMLAMAALAWQLMK